MTCPSLPALFLPHGSPMLVLEDNNTSRFLASLGERLPRPHAVVCMSAHWETVTTRVSVAALPATIHDFGPFDARLFEMHYPAPGEPELGERIVALLRQHGIEADADAERGLDHGVWALLKMIYPGADVPVVSVSVTPAGGARAQLDVGRALAGLRERGVLLLGSGSSTHNLRAADLYQPEIEPAAQALAFDQWLQQQVHAGDTQALLDYRERAPHAAWNHPTPEHLLPLFFPLGAASDSHGELLHEEIRYGTVGHSAFRWQ